MEEESVRFTVSKNVFYNPAMRFCRSMSSLVVGAIGDAEGKLDVVDAFCASGIRGIRYAKENKNVGRVIFIDLERSAINLAKKNARVNKIKNGALEGNISRLAFQCEGDFVEIDPFGTPSPYLVDALRLFNRKKTAYLSVTATDVAVLCGGKVAACLKNYHARPLNNDFTHENGLRILLGRMVEMAAEFNFGTEPLVSFSDRHYLKVIVRLRRGADLAYGCQKKQGYITWCSACGYRFPGQFPATGACGFCGANKNEFAGPLWLGELHDADFLKKMAALNGQRKYSDKEDIARMLSVMEGEIGMPPYYYNVHELCSIHHIQPVPKFSDFMGALEAKGHAARRTHFSPVSIKTAAPYREVLEALGWKG